jgi:outer membrane cobalamin receptor
MIIVTLFLSRQRRECIMTRNFCSPKTFILIPIFILISIITLSAQGTGRIFGMIHDQKTGKPVENVSVCLQPVSYGIETGPAGHYDLSGIPAGTYQIVISRIGYHSITDQTITIHDGDIIELNFDLQSMILSDIEGIVITATRSPSLSNTIPASVDLLDRIKLGHQNPQNLAEVLNNVPGLQIKDYGGLGGIKSVSMRGSNAEQVLVLLDGQRLNNPQNGQVDFSTLSATGLDRIEIVHGGNSALYGADAVGGVINLITRKDSEKPGLSGSFSTMLGSFNSRSLEGLLQYQQDKFSTALTYHDLNSTGNYSYADLNGQKQKRDNNDLFSQDLFARFSLDFGKLRYRQKLNLSYKFYYTERGSPGPLSFPSQTSRLYNRTDQINAWYSRKILNPLTELQIQGYAHLGWSRYTNDDYSIHDENSSHTGTDGLEAQIKTILAAVHQMIFGLGTRYDSMTGSDFSADHRRILYYLYIQDDLQYSFDQQSAIKSVLIIPALRFDTFSDFGSNFSPKIGSVINFRTTWDIALKGNAGFIYRAPIFNELYWPEDDWSKGNPDLKAESGYDWDIGLRLHPSLPVETGLDITYFQIRMNDLIAWQFQDQKYVPQNIDQTLSSGIEFKADLRPVKDVIAINYNYTYLAAINRKTDKTLNYRPRHTGNVSLIFSWSGAKCELQSQSVSSRFTDAANTQKLAAYTLYNIILSAHYIWGPVEPRISLQINNLQDRQYQIIQDYPLPGREARVNIGVCF